MTENKKNLIYASTIIVLIATLGIIWFFIIKATTPTTNSSTQNNQSTSASYSAALEISTDQTFTSGEYSSTTSDENAISATGNITASLSNITVTKSGDSDGDDNTVKNANLIATASEGVVIEGQNSVALENTTLTDTNNTLNGQSTTYKNIFLYQSMSGDATSGEAVFTAKNSNITTNQGDTFYVTNTTATINLENNQFINNDQTGNFLRVQQDSWGKSGSNGGTVTLNLTNQKASGNIVVDSISNLTMNLKSGSVYTGAINSDNTGEVHLTLDSSSTLTLTGDTYLTSLTNADSSNSNINLNGYKLFINGTELTK